MTQPITTLNHWGEPVAKAADVFKRQTCRLCGSSRLKLVVPFPATPVADAYVPAKQKSEIQPEYALDLYLCEGCGLVHLRDVVNPELIYRKYLYETTTSPGLMEHFRKYAQDVMGRIKPSKWDFVVEIGSNDGTLLNFFKEKGLRVLGIDPARDIAQKATMAGIETWPEFFTAKLGDKIKREKGAAHIIIANNVIANIDQLDELMEGIRALLAPDGVFIFETGYLVDSVQHMVFDNVYHEHISYFSVKPLDEFFTRQGMQLVRVDRVSTKGGSIRGTVQLAGGPRSVESSVPELIKLEMQSGIYEPKRYAAFAAQLSVEKRKLLELLKDLKSKGKTVAGYGASHSVTTFIYYFELGDKLEFLLDDNPRKHHTFSPGYHIPVFASEALYERKPDYIIILAWRFYEPIIQKHQGYLEQAGHFVIPLPKMKVI